MKNLLLLGALALSINAFGQVPNYVPSNGLVGWWGFNGNANDASINTNDGTVNGATLTTDRFGNASSAYDFDGMNDYIIVPDSPDLRLSNTNFTISTWVNFAPNTFSSILSKRSSYSGANGYVLSITDNSIVPPAQVQYTACGSSDPESNTQNSVPNSQWTNIIITYNLNTANLATYLNGLLDSVSINLFSPNNVTPDLYIGKDGFGNLYHFDGLIDDIGIWNRTLDSCEILDLYNASLGNCCTPNPITSQPTDVTVPLNGTGMFSITTSITSPTYQWQMNDGTGYIDLFNAGQFSGVDTDMLSVSNVTLGQNNTLFRCIVSENSDCSDTTDVAVLTVEDNTGLEDLNKGLFNIYPNPTSNSFTISSEKVINSEFKLIDAQGREVLTGFMNGQEHTIDISKLSNGVYSVVFNNAEYPVVSVIKE
jgi:hypothetical protein